MLSWPISESTQSERLSSHLIRARGGDVCHETLLGVKSYLNTIYFRLYHTMIKQRPEWPHP